jgi:hypothetical protein
MPISVETISLASDVELRGGGQIGRGRIYDAYQAFSENGELFLG